MGIISTSWWVFTAYLLQLFTKEERSFNHLLMKRFKNFQVSRQYIWASPEERERENCMHTVQIRDLAPN